MTRSFEIGACLVLAALSSSVAADPRTADAFGLYAAGSDPDRAAWSGVVMDVQSGDRQMVDAGPVEQIVLFAGPKSQPAGKDQVHLVAMLIDSKDNLVADGTNATLSPGDADPIAVETVDGIAEHLYDPGDLAGERIASAQSGAVQSARAQYRVVADIYSADPKLVDGVELQPETLSPLQTEPLYDAFGNVLEDGVGMIAWFVDERGLGIRLDAEVVAGSGRTWLLARGIRGQMQGRLYLGTKLTPISDFRIQTLVGVGAPEAKVERLPGTKTVLLSVGPFKTDAGYLLNDGAAVRIVARQAGGPVHIAETWAVDGMASSIVPDSVPGEPFRLRVETHLGNHWITVDSANAPEFRQRRRRD
jgi:hypothetical protein